jgi:hypothetical protein
VIHVIVRHRTVRILVAGEPTDALEVLEVLEDPERGATTIQLWLVGGEPVMSGGYVQEPDDAAWISGPTLRAVPGP